MPSLTELADNVEGKPQPTPSRSALPSVRFWSEGLDVPFKQSTYRILSRLGTGSFGTTFKVAQIDGEQEVGTFAAKLVFDRESGIRSLNAYRNARQHTKHPSLATIFEIESEWTESRFVTASSIALECATWSTRISPLLPTRFLPLIGNRTLGHSDFIRFSWAT